MNAATCFNFFVALLVTLCASLSSRAFTKKQFNTDELNFGDDTCSRILTHSENVQINRKLVDGQCLLDLHPMNVEALRYRDYLFTSEGLLMVFNSYGDGPNSSTTGARMFYIFPRIFKNPAVAIDSFNNVHIRLTSGQVLSISAEAFRLKSLSGGRVSESTELNKNNKGGVEIHLNQGLLLDLGFTMGQAPSASPIRSASFIDRAGSNCSVKNKEIFSYKDDAEFKFSDSELQEFLKQRCPKLDY